MKTKENERSGIIMDQLATFNEVMNSSYLIALATSVENIPNVRVVNFIQDENTPEKLYFATFKNNQKVKEFERNDSVSFTTVPVGDAAFVKVEHCKVKLTEFSIFDLENQFVSKIPSYKEIIDAAGPALAIYELIYSEATLTTDFKNINKITF